MAALLAVPANVGRDELQACCDPAAETGVSAMSQVARHEIGAAVEQCLCPIQSLFRLSHPVEQVVAADGVQLSEGRQDQMSGNELGSGIREGSGVLDGAWQRRRGCSAGTPPIGHSAIEKA